MTNKPSFVYSVFQWDQPFPPPPSSHPLPPPLNQNGAFGVNHSNIKIAKYSVWFAYFPKTNAIPHFSVAAGHHFLKSIQERKKKWKDQYTLCNIVHSRNGHKKKWKPFENHFCQFNVCLLLFLSFTVARAATDRNIDGQQEQKKTLWYFWMEVGSVSQ